MALTANRDVKYYVSQEQIVIPVDDNIVIYKGAFVGRNRSTGYARGLVAGDEFLGVAIEQVDNTISGHTAGGLSVKLQQQVDIVHTLTGVAQADIGKEAYASADDTLTLTPTGNSRIGRIVAVDASNLARVRAQSVFSLTGTLDNRGVVSLADASATLTLDHINRTLLIANTAARTLTLPPVASARAGASIRVVKTSAAAFAVTLDGNAAETIDGAATLATIDAQYDVAHLLCTSSEWIVLGRDIA